MRMRRGPSVSQMFGALVPAAALTLLVRWLGETAMAIALFVLLAVAMFGLLAVLRMVAVGRRVSRGGWQPPRRRGGDRRGPDGAGVREPRRPYPPRFPPRGAEAELPYGPPMT